MLEALSSEPVTRKIPFIFLSAKTERKDVRKGMELGADDYLTKPFEEEELFAAIESRIARAHILEDIREQNEKKDLVTGPRNLHELKNFIDDEGTEYDFSAGEAIYEENDHSNLVYLILRGVVKTHKLDEQGKDLITGIYREDEIFGLNSFSGNSPYPESATAIEPVKLTGISKDEIRKALEGNHTLALEFLQQLADSLTEAREQLLQMAYASVRRKTAATIIRFAEVMPDKPGGTLHIMRSDLASVAGIATETLIRTLSNFKEEGLISIENRDIRILDLAGLKRIR